MSSTTSSSSGNSGLQSGNEQLVLSKIYDELSNSMTDINALDERQIQKIFIALDKWEKTIEWMQANEAKQNPIHYFFYTFNKTIYKFVSMAFSNPRIEMPQFALSMKEIIEILKKIDSIYSQLVQLAKESNSKNISKIRALWSQIYGESDGSPSLMLELKKKIEEFLELIEKNLNPEDKEPILNSELMMPYETSLEVLKMHIPLLDQLNEVYWSWERGLQKYIEGKGADEKAKEIILSPVLSKSYKDRLNQFFLVSNFRPDFIVVGKHSSEKGKVKSFDYSNLINIVDNDITILPSSVFGENFKDFSQPMKLIIYKILQISDLSIRRGEYFDTGKLLHVLDEPGHYKRVKERQNKADLMKIRETFVINLKRFFLNRTIDKNGKEIPYPGVGTRNLGVGQLKMLRRLRHMSTSEETRELFKNIIQNTDKTEFNMVKKMLEENSRGLQKQGVKRGMDNNQGRPRNRGGKRPRKRKQTKRKKKKTKRRRKTRHKRRTKRRIKKGKSKRKKTKRRKRR